MSEKEGGREKSDPRFGVATQKEEKEKRNGERDRLKKMQKSVDIKQKRITRITSTSIIPRASVRISSISPMIRRNRILSTVYIKAT